MILQYHHGAPTLDERRASVPSVRILGVLSFFVPVFLFGDCCLLERYKRYTTRHPARSKLQIFWVAATRIRGYVIGRAEHGRSMDMGGAMHAPRCMLRASKTSTVRRIECVACGRVILLPTMLHPHSSSACKFCGGKLYIRVGLAFLRPYHAPHMLRAPDNIPPYDRAHHFPSRRPTT